MSYKPKSRVDANTDSEHAISREPSMRSNTDGDAEQEEEEDVLHLKHFEYSENYRYHANKGGQFKTKEPIDKDDPNSYEPGCGCPTDTRCGKCAHFCGPYCLCPTRVEFDIEWKRVLTRVVMCILFWGFFWSITAITDYEALPQHNLFAILMVFLFGIVGESLIDKIPLPFGLPGLPPLLASLVIGMMLRNVPGISCAKYILPNWSYTLRQMALGIILGEAGVEVDKKQMYMLRWVVPRLSFLPCLSEAFSWGIFSHWILQLPWAWSFMLGFVCGAVAPACVVPSMIKFQAKGMGVLRGCCTLFMAAASIDDIIAINGFNIVLTITFSTAGGVGYDIGVACVEIVLGIILGMICGYLMWVFPDARQHNIIRDRAFLLVFTSWFLIFMTNVVNLSGAGTLGTLTCSFVGSLGWPEEQVEAVAKIYKSLWFIFQPLLFGLTGANVDVTLMDGRTIGLAIACLCICLSIRLTVAGSAVSFLGWRYREKFMAAVSWVPKATVQAAIGGVALDRANALCLGQTWLPLCNHTTVGTDMHETTPNMTTMMPTTWMNTTIDNATYTTPVPTCVDSYAYPTPEYCSNITKWATIILQVSVVVILVTAPIGVFLIGALGPILLKVDDPNLTKPESEETPSTEEKKSTQDGYQNDVFDLNENVYATIDEKNTTRL